MKTQTLLVVLVGVIGLIFLLVRQEQNTSAQSHEMATSTLATTTNAVVTPTFESKPKVPVTSSSPVPTSVRKQLLPFLSQSQSSKCSYETVTPTTRSSSVLFMSKGVLRGEFRTWSGDITSSDIVHYDGTYVYVWKEGMSTGTKRLVNTLADLPALIPRDLTSGSVFGTATNNASWDCHQWIIEPSKVKVPSYVTFK